MKAIVGKYTREQPRRGGCAIKKKLSHQSCRRGGAGQEFLDRTTPFAPARRVLTFRANELPSSAEEGWMRDQEKVAKPPNRADGVVLARIS